jgi:hypothetical protein
MNGVWVGFFARMPERSHPVCVPDAEMARNTDRRAIFYAHRGRPARKTSAS